VCYVRYYTDICLCGLKTATEDLGLDSRSPDPISTQELKYYEAEVETHRPAGVHANHYKQKYLYVCDDGILIFLFV
jgi:hypothetical protein